MQFSMYCTHASTYVLNMLINFYGTGTFSFKFIALHAMLIASNEFIGDLYVCRYIHY